MKQLTSDDLFLQLGYLVRERLSSDNLPETNGIRPYWNPFVKKVSQILWLPSDLSEKLSDKTVTETWFSALMTNPIYPQNSFACLSLVVSPESPVGLRTKKIRVCPDEKQKEILKQWLGTARFVSDRTIAFLNQPGTVANWIGIKTGIIRSLPDWAKIIPYQVKSKAVEDACIAVRNAKAKYEKTGQKQNVRFRSKRSRRDSAFIPKQSVRDESFFVRYLGKNLKMSESLPEILHDCRLKYDNGKFWLCVPVPKADFVSENQRYGAVALDPGVRTFQTFFSPVMAGKIGGGDFGKIHRLCKHLDNLYSEISKAKCKQKRRMLKAAFRIREKIRNLIDELHHKTACFLCKNFSVIFLPTFGSSRMVTKLRSKTARAMLTWSHFRFSEFLSHKAEEFGTRVIRVCEAYTSKTCSACGKIQNIGSRKILKCSCGLVIDRDINGARGIFLRALADTPSFGIPTLLGIGCAFVNNR